jgi:hypothetical protein
MWSRAENGKDASRRRKDEYEEKSVKFETDIWNRNL